VHGKGTESCMGRNGFQEHPPSNHLKGNAGSPDQMGIRDDRWLERSCGRSQILQRRAVALSLSLSLSLCVCVCVCVCRGREREKLYFDSPHAVDVHRCRTECVGVFLPCVCTCRMLALCWWRVPLSIVWISLRLYRLRVFSSQKGRAKIGQSLLPFL